MEGIGGLNMEPLRCCSNLPKFLVTYALGSKFLVCTKCMEVDYWQRGLRKKKCKNSETKVRKKRIFKNDEPKG